MEEVIINGTVYVKKSGSTGVNDELITIKENLDWFEHDLNDCVNYAKELYDDFKEHGFSVNSVEAEGYLRGITHIRNRFKMIIKGE